MLKNKKLAALLVMSAASLAVLGACGGGDSEDPNGYTYNTYLSTSPSKWNVHTWETSDESYIQSFTEVGLYDVALNPEKNGYRFISEMAADMPTQIDPTELSMDDYDAIAKKYYSGGDFSIGQVWEIPLRKTAKWEDGTAITADDYVESMSRLLDPHYANYRADSYYNGNFVIANAENYYKNGNTTLENVYGYLNRGGWTGNLIDTDGKSSAQNQNDFYIDLCRGASDYAASVFSNDDTSSLTFYTVLNQRSTTASNAVELAAKRITLGVSYYYWKFLDHSESSDKDDWDEIKKASSVTSTMMSSLAPIRIREFDSKKVMTTASLDSNDTDTRYTMADLKKDLSTFVSGISSSTAFAGQDWAWQVPLMDYIRHKKDDSLTMDNVGVAKVDEYTIRLYLSKAIAELDLKFQLSSNWLVKTDLYDKLTVKTSSTSWATSYATASASNYKSYGPYKLTNFTAGSTITIEKNEQWYGYSDADYRSQFDDYPDDMKPDQQFKMTKISTSIIKTHETAISEFMAGRLDDIDLNRGDMSKYGNSSRRTTTLESYTQKLSFNTSRSKLLIRQGNEDGVNKTILANKNFRKGLSLALDRNNFASQTTAGSAAFTGLLNELYLANTATGEMYRNTAQGKSVYNAIYGELGGTPEDAETSALSESAAGYNRSWAVHYVVEGLKEELESTEEGHIEAGDVITIEFRVYDNTSDTTIAMNDFILKAWTSVLEDAVAEIKEEDKTKEGTHLLPDGKSIGIKISLVKDEDYYTSAHNGNYDMIFSIWGGAAIDPYGLMQVYLDSTFSNCCEYGFKGNQKNEDLWIDLNGDGLETSDETKSYDDWYHVMNDDLNEGEYSEAAKSDPTDPDYATWSAVHEKRLTVLAGTEAGIINRFEAIPVVARGSSSLTGFKIDNATNSYVNLVGYGGIRFLKFNYTNSEWNSFVNSYNSNLSDLYANWRS